MITQELLKELLHYDPETGIFVWKKKISCKVIVGGIAGSKTNGYLEIGIFGKSYKAHRLAWLYIFGVWPNFDIDHKDSIKHHNWIDNLREVTKSGNQQNQIRAQRSNKTGFLGVSFHKTNGKYRAVITVNNKQKFIGLYETPEDAHAAYVSVKRKLHLTCTI